ncbi:MAG: hypothetical protein U0Q11_18190 [Vicinamibacterales bacterium]
MDAQLPTMQAEYRRCISSAVLPDGRVVVEGGVLHQAAPRTGHAGLHLASNGMDSGGSAERVDDR